MISKQIISFFVVASPALAVVKTYKVWSENWTVLSAASDQKVAMTEERQEIRQTWFIRALPGPGHTEVWWVLNERAELSFLLLSSCLAGRTGLGSCDNVQYWPGWSRCESTVSDLPSCLCLVSGLAVSGAGDWSIGPDTTPSLRYLLVV